MGQLASAAPPGGVAISDTTAFGAIEPIRATGRRSPEGGSTVRVDAVDESSHAMPSRQPRRS